MPVLPERPDIDHLRKQAKDLLRAHRAHDPRAAERFAASLPLARGRSADAAVALDLSLHDARSCVAREYGFPSWLALKARVEAGTLLRGTEADHLRRAWLDLVYGGDVTGRLDAARPRVAAEILRDRPDVAGRDPLAACATGDVAVVSRAIAADPAWAGRVGGPLRLPPLVAVTHSRLGHLPAFRDGLRTCARALLASGADPNGSIGNRFPPASLAAPDESARLSALYGAAGVHRDPILTEILLDAGADPNDGESLYHSLENPACTRLLLAKGARIAGTNALRRALDMPEPEALELLLARGGDPNEPPDGGPGAAWGAPLLRAIALRCSPRHVAALLDAGADPGARTPGGVSAYRLALHTGALAVAARLEAAGAGDRLSEDDRFVAACARADAGAARLIQARRPDLPGSLPPDRLRLLPDTAAWGSSAATRVMVELGWPVAVRGGDWNATALNHAVLRGDPTMTEFLLAHGADRRERHGYGDDVLGTLSWASINEPSGPCEPDWAACASALAAQDGFTAERDPSEPDLLIVDGRRMRFSPDVRDALLGVKQPGRSSTG